MEMVFHQHIGVHRYLQPAGVLKQYLEHAKAVVRRHKKRLAVIPPLDDMVHDTRQCQPG
jgi:hypothetical protein